MSGRIYLYPYAGPGGRNYLSKQVGTRQDLDANGIELREDLRLQFYCDDGDRAGKRDDLLFEGTVHFDADRREWYALIDEGSYRHTSDG